MGVVDVGDRLAGLVEWVGGTYLDGQIAVGGQLSEFGELGLLAHVRRRSRRWRQDEPRLAVTAAMGLDIASLQTIIDSYQRTNPTMPPARIAVRGWGRADAMVRDGRADVALLRNPFDGRGLDVEPLATEPQVALLPTRHQLTHRPGLRLADLEGEPVLPTPDVDMDVHLMLETVALGQAVAVVPASLAKRIASARAGGVPGAPDVTARPLSGAEPSTLHVAWLDGSHSLAVAAFVRAACEVIGEVVAPPPLPAEGGSSPLRPPASV